MKPEQLEQLRKEARQRAKESKEIIRLQNEYDVMKSILKDPEQIRKLRKRYNYKKYKYIEKWDEQP